MTKEICIGVSGDVGSFSEQAALKYASQHDYVPVLIYLLDMENVLNELEKATVDLGVFPVVNFRGGWVKPAFEAMGNHFFMPIDELWLDVQQCLLTMPGTKKDEITQIVSHPQGLAQCQSYLKKEFQNIKQIKWIDTAKAAKDLEEGKLPATTAVIAPARSAAVYHLNKMAENIQDDSPNYTIFIIAKKRQGGLTHAGN